MKYKKTLFIILSIIILFTGCNQITSNTSDTGTQNDKVIIEEEIISNANNQEIEYFTVTKDNSMENRGLILEIIGSAVYDKIEGEDITDIPTGEKKFLVLFLKIQNRTGKDEYFNYNNIVTTLDGIEIEDTFLINNLEGYDTIKTTLTDGKNTLGYLVWEVPQDWKELKVRYTGWSQNYYTEPTIILTPNDLEMPKEYNPDNRYI